MSGRTFVDSNVLIYAYNSDAGTKRRIANSIPRELWEQRLVVLRVQVSQEFYVKVTRKIAKPIPKSKARLFAITGPITADFSHWSASYSPIISVYLYNSSQKFAPLVV